MRSRRYRLANNANRAAEAASSRRIVRDGLCSRWSTASRLRVAFPAQMVHLREENLISDADSIFSVSIRRSLHPLSLSGRLLNRDAREISEFKRGNEEYFVALIGDTPTGARLSLSMIRYKFR